MQKLIKKHAEKIRFGIVGVANTAIDVAILFTLRIFGLPDIPSNIISTSVALVFSFFANKTFTFKGKDKINGRQIIYFLIITLFGLWVIQSIIITGTNLLLGSWFTDSLFVAWIGDLLGLWFKASYLVLLIGKGFATIASLIWNYILYRKFVFKQPQSPSLDKMYFL